MAKMRVSRKFLGRNGFAAALVLLLPLGKTAWLPCSAWAAAWMTKTAWVYTGLNRHAAHSLDKAILVIGLPPVFFFVALFFYVRRRSRTWRGENDKDAVASSDLNPTSSPPRASGRTRA